MPPCHYFNKPGGCRRGTTCTFTHGSQPASPAGTGPGTSHKFAGPSSASSRRPSHVGTPNGVCSFYWTTGKCKREFDCRYRHDRNPERSQASSSASSPINGARSLSAVDAIAPFLTESGLAKLGASGTDAFFASPHKTMSPNEAHNALKMYLRDDYRFSKTFYIYGFLTPVSNATTSNVTWTSEDGQLFLTSFATTCMDTFMTVRSFKDPQTPSIKDPIGSQVLASLAGVLFECLTRFKNSTSTHPVLNTAVRSLQGWLDSWITGISSSPPCFDDPFKDTTQAARDHIIGFLKNKVERLVHIVDREQAKIDRASRRAKSMAYVKIGANLDEGIISALRLTYDGPGDNSRVGVPRHDNDFVYIEDIRIAPTNEELICTASPFLPVNLYGAPHPHPDESMQRLLDVQFRLLREELTAPLRTSVQLVRQDLLSHKKKKSRLDEILKDRGGKYRGVVDAQEGVMFNVYTGVKFLSLLPDRRGLSVSFSFDTPPGRARAAQSKARQSFWEGMSGKRMMQGGLIALVWMRGNEVDVHLGILASSVKEITESVKAEKDRVAARVVFFDPDIELRILNILKDPRGQNDSTTIMVESPVMFEAIRPFLDALKTVEPESIPFGQYLVHRPLGYFPGSGVLPPRYARTPGFAFQLAPLFPPEAGVEDLKLYVNDPESIASARRRLQQSRLDPSQAEAVVDALIREVSLIQGPPGTGKSFTGIELLRVLIKSATPILMIAFTNHALDHLMTGVLDAGITDKIVRLGGRSADERIKKFSIEEIEHIAGRSRLDRSFARDHWDLKNIEKEILQLMEAFARTIISSDEITEYLMTQHPEHSEHLGYPPSWISALHALSLADTEAGWQTVGSRGPDQNDQSLYSFWERRGDLEFLSGNGPRDDSPLPEPAESPRISIEHPSTNKFALLQNMASTNDEDEVDLQPWEISWLARQTNDTLPSPPTIPVPPPEARPPSPAGLQISDLRDPAVFFAAHGYANVPDEPTSDRPLDFLLEEGNMWAFSATERKKLHAYWEQRVREGLYQNNIENFERLRKKYTKALQVYNEGKDEARRQLLSSVDIIGCTTTGAAKLTSLLKGLGPRIVLVEEAGQVLEAHILGSLVPSVEHIILIGDPLQLRPTLNNYSLSVDSRQGNQLYKFDMSLMERLSSSGFPITARNTLYPNLVDHEIVTRYPDVRGFAKNVFFLSHNHRENGGAEESSSKYNTYEVEMIRDLVLYLLRQGCYSQEGDIVVLCAYLGQLARVRDALVDLVAVVIDERDQAELADQEGEQAAELMDDTRVEHVKVAQRGLTLFKILVRNAGDMGDGRSQRSTIGFLKVNH
ncbi:hypothetical protein DXG01_005039 [Tephrocybe rancida]|nr:hypothetical protein DXG01_005039 [Tephrocybe rancida]